MIRVEVYGRCDCCLCEEVTATLLKVRREIPFDLREIDIESRAELYEAYKKRIPLVFINGRLAFKFRVDEAALRRRLAREKEMELAGTGPETIALRAEKSMGTGRLKFMTVALSGGWKMVRDPVCGMEVEEEKAHAWREHAGRTFFFCSAKCEAAFAVDPGRYAGEPAAQRGRHVPSATTGVREGLAGPQRVELPVFGLTCARCVQAVEKAL
ncbi:MAG: YHS domain-containing protein [Candidatus Tectomicrobia bacterium]|uniref:YHS domain-containing protein n=1 Tax=Tectimicrobiota bacterium TaxID=2528274 RepID=A0A932LZP9_UNCTE|nr:YHS domain-containing protein [Candidatus Tectomicrobia bacterium]